MAKFNDGGEYQGGRKPMQPGEYFTFNRKDKNDQPNGTLTIERTARPYAYDLCDAYNKSMRPDLKAQGAEWFVDSQGQVKLGQNAEWSKAHAAQIAKTQEYERQQWLRHNRRQDDGAQH